MRWAEWSHMQKSYVKVKWLREKDNSSKVKYRCQLVVKLKANKCYQKLLYFLSSFINLLNLLYLQGLRSRLLTPGRFQNSSPWSKLLTNFNLKGGAYTCACVWPIIWSIVWSIGRDPTALKWIACFVAIQPLSDESLNLSCLVCQWFLVIRLCELSCPLAPQIASGPRQNLFTNRLRTCIWSSTRITLDHLAIIRFSIFGKLLALWLGNLRLPLLWIVMVGWSWC